MRLLKRKTGQNGTFIKNTAIFTAMTVLQRCLGFILLPIYTHYMIPEQNGIYNLVHSLFALYTLLFSFALDDAIAKRYFELSGDKEKQKRVVGTIVLFALAISVGGGLLLVIFRFALLKPFAAGIKFFPYLILGLIPAVTTSVYNIMQKIFLIEEKAMTYSFFTLAFFLVHTGLSIFFVVFCKLQAIGLLASYAVSYIVFMIIALIVLRRKMTFCFDTKEVKWTFFYCIKLLPNRIATWGSSSLNNIIVGNFVSKAVLGVYSISLQFQNILIILANSLSHAVQPWVYKNIRNGTSDGKEKVFNSICLLYAFLGFGVSLYSVDIIKWFFKASYQGAAAYIPLLVLGSAFSAVSSILVYYLFYYDDLVVWVSISTCIGVAFDVLVSFALVKHYAAWACAIAATVAAFARSLTIIIKALKRSGLKINLLLIFGFPVVNYIVAQVMFNMNFFVKLIPCVSEAILLFFYFKKSNALEAFTKE